ncbi:MAG: phosphatidylserine decarboxylase [Bacteroidetes bacterium]|nr:phosphatidylserine decarboxylase [Bacteroidota bacterium]
MQNGIQIQNRDGSTFIEETPGRGFLNFLYGTNPLGKLGVDVLVKRKFFSVLFGKYMDSSLSKGKIAPFIEKYKMDMDPYIIPNQGFAHFNDFFYRKIKPEFRPIGDGFVCPADGRIVAFDTLEEGQKFYVKGKQFDLETFLGDKQLADQYSGGAMLVVRLAPVDYHRYHFPTSGIVGPSKVINGYYYSVSPIALKNNWAIFWQNERSYAIQDSAEFGKVLICDVGATLTGSIIQTYEENTFVEKGAEKGHFAFGGSTLVVLLEPGKINFDRDIKMNSSNGKETYVKMGETIGSAQNL